MYKCKICGSKISWQTALYGSKLCQSCSHKNKPSGRKGKRHSEKSKELMRKANLGKK